MSFIQFESANEKEKIRQELRQAREQMLEKAKRNAEQRAQKRTEEVLRGEDQWILPTVAAKIGKMTDLDKISKKSAKKEKKKKAKSKLKSKKSKKKSSKKRKHHSSTSSESSNDSSDSSEEERVLRRRKRHKESSTSDSDEEVTPRDKEEYCKSSSSNPQKDEPLQRDSWMTDTLMLKTFSRTRPDKQVNEKQNIDSYDPAKSSRELNPYWKSTGTGLPGFQKPKNDSEEEHEKRSNTIHNVSTFSSSSRGWRKSSYENDHKKESSSRMLSTPDICKKGENIAPTPLSNDFLTDQQMNELGAKILKAEIMGNLELAAELKKKLEKSRENRNKIKTNQRHDSNKVKGNTLIEEEEDILLTRTDSRGNCRPLAQSKTHKPAENPSDMYGGRSSGRKKHAKRVETHTNGERVRYFPDDDKYDIKQMFEREKYTSASDNNLQFAAIASKSKNRNDDMDDIFADKIRHDQSQDVENTREMQSAINEQRQLTKQLDNCDKCFDSNKMDKKMLVSMGDKSYLALPWHVGLQPGHCIIAPLQHVVCSTQLDEDTWEEINNFRKALTRMFNSQHKDVIFFEVANKLHRHPHLTIHCIPISERVGEMAPFYFKKAIEESEHEWSVNKQLVSLRNKNLRNAIPKGLDYFWVHFGMETGFAHVIEDQSRFPSNFAMEIIGGMLHLDANSWRRPKKEQNIIVKVKLFADSWKKYDFTV